MSKLSSAFGRALIATGVAVALGSASLLGASAATAATDDEVLAANSGTILVRLPGDFYANATVVVSAPIPGTDDVRVVSAAVEPEADTDGYVAELENLAGPVLIELENGSAAGDALAETGEWESNAVIVRQALIDYTLDEETGEYVTEDFPASPVPNSEELALLVPTTDYTFTPTSYTSGASFTIAFRNIVSTVDGHVIGEEEPRDVTFYGYSEPKFIGDASIVGGSLDFVVPVEYTTAPHEIAAFDEFGRVNLWVTLDGGLAAPVADPAQPANRPALANTGAADSGAFTGLGIGALVLGAGVVVAGVLIRRRGVQA
jgi:hypothetical protein